MLLRTLIPPLYNAALYLFLFLASPALIYKLATKRKTRAGFFQKTGIRPDKILPTLAAGRPIWVHAVSVGETIAAIPLVRELKKAHPGRKIVVSTVTLTGYNTAREKLIDNEGGADAVIFAPYDVPPVVNKLISIINPSLYMVIETELWPNMFWGMKKRGIPAMIVNGRISDSSFKGYMRVRSLLRTVLSDVTALCMQSVTDVDRIIAMGALPGNVVKTGSIKFGDR